MKTAVMVSWEDVPHLSEDQKKSILAGIPAWQRDARTRGVPQLGAGAIYQVPEADLKVNPFAISRHWRRRFAIHVRWHRTGVPFFCIDPDTDTVYCYGEYYRGTQDPSVHAHAIQARGKWLPGVID